MSFSDTSSAYVPPPYTPSIQFLLLFIQLLTHLSPEQLVSQNHDNQVRFRWHKNDVAIWDNRSNWHAATYDYNDVRIGDRVVSLGEAPYYDPASGSRREALEKRAEGLVVREKA
jgi:alpha-ketoglutarate-dependent taurine dioxygenase